VFVIGDHDSRLAAASTAPTYGCLYDAPLTLTVVDITTTPVRVTRRAMTTGCFRTTSTLALAVVDLPHVPLPHLRRTFVTTDSLRGTRRLLVTGPMPNSVTLLLPPPDPAGCWLPYRHPYPIVRWDVRQTRNVSWCGQYVADGWLAPPRSCYWFLPALPDYVCWTLLPTAGCGFPHHQSPPCCELNHSVTAVYRAVFTNSTTFNHHHGTTHALPPRCGDATCQFLQHIYLPPFTQRTLVRQHSWTLLPYWWWFGL